MTNEFVSLFVCLLSILVWHVVDGVLSYREEWSMLELSRGVRLVLVVIFTAGVGLCCCNKDAALVVLDKVEINMICRHRAEQELVKAQQEWQKLQTGKDNDDVK